LTKNKDWFWELATNLAVIPLLGVLFFSPVGASQANGPIYIGKWVVEQWTDGKEPELVITPDIVDIRACKGIPYRQVRRYAPDADNEYYAIELLPAAAGCARFRNPVWRIRASKALNGEPWGASAVHLSLCPNVEEADRLARGENERCEGEFHYH
jgi:hypothetical protein